jgi:hypothetical protein
VRLLLGFKVTQTYSFILVHDLAVPLVLSLVPTGALKPSATSFRIGLSLGGGSFSQIYKPVVVADAVDVIQVFWRKITMNIKPSQTMRVIFALVDLDL